MSALDWVRDPSRRELVDGLRDRAAPALARLPTGPATVDVGTTLRLPQRSVPEVEHVRAIRREAGHIAALRERTHADDVVWDVGANIGAYTAALAPVADHIVAFEPAGSNRDEIGRTLAINDVETATDVIGAALADEVGLLPFETDPRGAVPGAGRGGLAAHRPGDRSMAGQTLVHCLPGDEVVDAGHAPAPDLLKVDVEGAEVAVLDGLVETLYHDPPRVVQVETHGADRHEWVRERLVGRGYDVVGEAGSGNGLLRAVHAPQVRDSDSSSEGARMARRRAVQ